MLSIIYLIFIGSEGLKYSDEKIYFDTQIEKLSVLYMNRYEGGKAIIENETISYRTSPELITRDFKTGILKPTKCLKYNDCPEGDLITETRIKKVSMPDDSVSSNCGGTYLVEGVEKGEKITVPSIFYNNQWGPKAYRCEAILSGDSLRYAIKYQKYLATVYNLCSETYGGDVNWQVINGDIRVWTQCIISNVKSWISQNGEFPYKHKFGAAVWKIKKSCSIKMKLTEENVYYPPRDMPLDEIKIWNKCVVSKAQLLLEE